MPATTPARRAQIDVFRDPDGFAAQVVPFDSIWPVYETPCYPHEADAECDALAWCEMNGWVAY